MSNLKKYILGDLDDLLSSDEYYCLIAVRERFPETKNCSDEHLLDLINEECSSTKELKDMEKILEIQSELNVLKPAKSVFCKEKDNCQYNLANGLPMYEEGLKIYKEFLEEIEKAGFVRINKFTF